MTEPLGRAPGPSPHDFSLTSIDSPNWQSETCCRFFTDVDVGDRYVDSDLLAGGVGLAVPTCCSQHAR